MVARDDLQQLLWPGETYVDFEDGISTAVRKVRTALGDSATNPRFIETLPKRGYRFIAPVFPDGGAAKVVEPDRDPPSAERPRRLAFVAASAVAAACVFVFFYPREAKMSVDDLLGYFEVPLTSYRGIEGGPSLSPDSRQVAFTWNGGSGDNWDIYIKLVDSTTDKPTRLTDDPAFDYSPAWSPDGSRIAFLRSSSSQETDVTLMVMSALGGGTRTVRGGLNRPGGVFGEAKALMTQVAWSPDGRFLAFSALKDESDEPTLSLALTPLDGSDVRWLTGPTGDYGACSPAFSPNGNRIAFVRRVGWGSGHDIYVLDLGSDSTPRAAPRRLTNFARSVGNPAWTSDNDTLLFWGEKSGGQSGLWAVSASGAEPARLVRPNSRLNSLPLMNTLTITADEPSQSHRLAFPVVHEDRDIWEVDVAGLQAGNPRPLVETNAVEAGAVVSPDGSRLAFISDQSGDRELWITDRNGGQAVQLTHLGSERMGLPDWSPDGTSIVVHGYANGQGDIYLVNAATGASSRLVATPADEQQPSWSPDGKWIYFVSLAGGARATRRITADGETEELAAAGVGGFPRESEDGSVLVYGGNEDPMYLPLENGEVSGPPRRLPFHGQRRRGATSQGIAPGGIYYVAEGHLMFFDLERQASRELFPIEDQFSIVSVTEDGKTVILNRTEQDVDLALLRAP